MSQLTTNITQIGLVMVPVADQDRALAFYVETLGFEKRADVPFGDGYRWPVSKRVWTPAPSRSHQPRKR